MTRVVNPIVLGLGLAGGRRSAWGTITTVGRRSRRDRTNPVLAHVSGDLVVIPLSYGHDVHWARNVLAAGRASLRHHGETLIVVDPQLIDLAEVRPLLPPRMDVSYERMRVTRFLRLRITTQL